MDRTQGIGGTDIAAIIGLNPWKSAIDVYMEKLGLTEPQEDNESMWWGREMEPILQKRYEQETGHKVKNLGMGQHLDYEWYVGSPDGLIFLVPDKIIGGVDYKTTGYSKLSDWGEPGSDEVPPYYHTQAMWYMGLTGAQWWDIAVLFMGARREFKIYRINRDDELIATLIEKGKDFWENHVLKQTPPSVDASPGWNKFFKAKYPREEEDLIEFADADLIGKFMLAKDELTLWETETKKYENQIKAILENHAGLVSPWGKITWKASKDRTIVNWEEAFNEAYQFWLSGANAYQSKEEILKRFTTIKPGPRVFRVTLNKEKDNE